MAPATVACIDTHHQRDPWSAATLHYRRSQTLKASPPAHYHCEVWELEMIRRMTTFNHRPNCLHSVSLYSNNTLLHRQSSHHGPAELAHQGTALAPIPLDRIVPLQEHLHYALEGSVSRERRCEELEEHRKARKRRSEIERSSRNMLAKRRYQHQSRNMRVYHRSIRRIYQHQSQESREMVHSPSIRDQP